MIGSSLGQLFVPSLKEAQLMRHGSLASERLKALKLSQLGLDSEFIVWLSTVQNTETGGIKTGFVGSEDEWLFYAKSVSTPDETINSSFDSEKMHVVLNGIDHPTLTMQLYAVRDESIKKLFELYSNQFTEEGTFRLFSTNDGILRVYRNITSEINLDKQTLGYKGFTLRGLRFSRPLLSSADSSSNAVSLYTVNINYQVIEFML